MSKKRNKGIIEILLTSLGAAIWRLISGLFRRRKAFNKLENNRKILEIENLLETGDVIHAEQAIVKLDKFFDEMLKQTGAQGETFADRLRNSENLFNRQTYNDIWEAHKLRNRIAHDVDVKISVGECKAAVNKFKSGLHSLGAL